MKRLFQILALSALTLGASSCHVHEEPEGDLAQFTLHLNFDTEFQMMEYDLTDSRENVSRDYTTDLDHGIIQYTLKCYPLIKGEVDRNIYKEFVFTRDINDGFDCSYTFDLGAGNYRMMLFAQLAETPQGPFYYDDSNFWDIKLQGQYVGDSDYRDAFRGLIDVKVGQTFSATMEMTRPLGKYEFVTTDLPAFIDQETVRRSGMNTRDTRVALEDYKVVFKYIGYMPSAYNLPEDRTVDSLTGIEYESTIEQLSSSLAILGFDYVFVSQTGTNVTLQVYLYDNVSGELLNISDQVKIPLKRSYDTIVYGTFLYGEEQGGIGIDPGFNGDLNIFFDPSKQ